MNQWLVMPRVMLQDGRNVSTPRSLGIGLPIREADEGGQYEPSCQVIRGTDQTYDWVNNDGRILTMHRGGEVGRTLC